VNRGRPRTCSRSERALRRRARGLRQSAADDAVRLDQAAPVAQWPSLCARRGADIPAVAEASGQPRRRHQIVATQVPRGIHNQVVSNCTTQFFGRQSAPATIAAAQDIIAASGGRADDIVKLKAGEFYFATEGSEKAGEAAHADLPHFSPTESRQADGGQPEQGRGACAEENSAVERVAVIILAHYRLPRVDALMRRVHTAKVTSAVSNS
jgi:hypothetical protein